MSTNVTMTPIDRLNVLITYARPTSESIQGAKAAVHQAAQSAPLCSLGILDWVGGAV